MNKSEVVKRILEKKFQAAPKNSIAEAFAPSNIALCKYWGKRNQELNLPVTSSLSVSLKNKGTTTQLKIIDEAQDIVNLNNQSIDLFSPFGKRLLQFLNLFRKNGEPHFIMNIHSNIPISAGMASSASGFASIVQAMDKLFDWKLRLEELSVLARLGSGSACRSLWQGFVEWHIGIRDDGMDSHGEAISEKWPELCVGILLLSMKEKSIGSREAMQRTVTTSSLYPEWPTKVNHDLLLLKQAISLQDFQLLGKTAESNALTMHATMLSAWPPIIYFLPETIDAMNKIWQLRRDGVTVYFTEDAGPNLKLLFLKQNLQELQAQFPELDVVEPFG